MITREIQKQLFDEYRTPDHVRRHCDAVTDAAVKIGRALNRAGSDLDIDLIEGAARVHDVARTAHKHADVGADFLIEQGYLREAELVRKHMVHPFGSPDEINEQDVLCLADRVVREDEYVGIEKRVEYLMSKPGMTDEGRERMMSVMDATRKYIAGVEKIMGISLDELLK